MPRTPPKEKVDSCSDSAVQTVQTIRALKLSTHFFKCWSPPSPAVFTLLFFYFDLNCQIDHSVVQHTCGSKKKAR